MADSSLNRFLSSGTTAERTGFTPDPPTPASGPDPSYVWWDVDDQVLYAYDFGLADWVAVGGGGPGSSVVVQVVNTQTGAVATGSTTIPIDDTIPQITEGDEYMTLAITPTDAANLLRVDVVFNGTQNTTNRNLTVALFRDATSNALAATTRFDVGSVFIGPQAFTHVVTAGSTSATTFRVRAGVETSGTVTFNGAGGSRFLGGVFASSITITEIVP